jgi:hypothetical protein
MTTAKYAEGTTVSVESSQMEARKLLRKYGAGDMRITDGEGRAILEFVMENRLIRFLVAAPDLDAPEIARDRYGGPRPLKDRQRLAHAEYRRRWRALLLRLKGKLESVVGEGVDVHEEFLANLVTPDGRTVGEILLPQIEEVYRTGRVPALMPESLSTRAIPPYVRTNGGEE